MKYPNKKWKENAKEYFITSLKGQTFSDNKDVMIWIDQRLELFYNDIINEVENLNK
jgi:hypothetical protein